jgi:hypothetical protein
MGHQQREANKIEERERTHIRKKKKKQMIQQANEKQKHAYGDVNLLSFFGSLCE